MQTNKNQTLLFLSIVCFILLIRNALLIKFIEPTGYVSDIYSMFPFSFYLGLIFCYFVASLLVLSRKKTIGVSIFCLNHLEVLLIPYMLRYYSMGRADDMSYIGEYLHITNSGHFANWDIYPASHIIGSSISIISGIEVNLTSFIIPILFSFLFITGIYVFTRQLSHDSCVKAITIASSFILYLGIYNFLNVPHSLFFAFTPLYLFVLYSYIDKKENSLPFSIVFVLMTLFIPYTHPFVVFFVIMLFLFHTVFNSFFVQEGEKLQIPKLKFNALMLLLISFLCWFIYQGRLLKSLTRLFNAYINQIGRDPTAQWTSEKLAQIHFSLYDYLQLVSFFYGRYIFPTVFLFLGALILYYKRNIFKNVALRNYQYLFILYIFFLIIQFIFLFNPIIAHQPDRIMNLNVMVYGQIPLFAFSLYIIFLRRSKSFYSISLICLILTSIWTFSFFGCFDSPRVYRTNVALTYNEVEGMDWFYDVKNDNAFIGVPYSQIYRFHDLFDERDKKDNLKNFPDHFGYSNNSHNIEEINFGQDDNFYVIVLTIDELLYQEIPSYVAVGRYYKSDFIRLRSDMSVNKIYDSMNIEIFSSHMS